MLAACCTSNLGTCDQSSMEGVQRQKGKKLQHGGGAEAHREEAIPCPGLRSSVLFCLFQMQNSLEAELPQKT